MKKATGHNQLIALAAKRALEPLGCVRKGRSRIWLADQGYWLIVIEFQPSGWAKGSYLNVGAMWPWYERQGVTFNAGYRIADFVPFENVEQFAPLVDDLAGKAAREVQTLRQRFGSTRAIYDYLLAQPRRDGWPAYRTALAAALVGEVETARSFFDALRVWPTHGYDWEQQLKRNAASLADLIDDPSRLRAAILNIIQRQRARLRLPDDPERRDLIERSIAAR